MRVLSILCQRRILHLEGFTSVLCPLCTFSISIFFCVRVIWPKSGMAALKCSGNNARARKWKLCASTKLSIQCLCTALFTMAHQLAAHKGFVVLLIFVGVIPPSSLYFKDQLHAEGKHLASSLSLSHYWASLKKPWSSKHFHYTGFSWPW